MPKTLLAIRRTATFLAIAVVLTSCGSWQAGQAPVRTI